MMKLHQVKENIIFWEKKVANVFSHFMKFTDEIEFHSCAWTHCPPPSPQPHMKLTFICVP